MGLGNRALPPSYVPALAQPFHLWGTGRSPGLCCSQPASKPSSAGSRLSSLRLFAPGLRLGQCPASSWHPSLEPGCTRAGRMGGPGSPLKQVLKLPGMVKGCLCAPVSNKLLPWNVWLWSGPPLLQSPGFCTFLHPGNAAGERSAAKGGIWGCF